MLTSSFAESGHANLPPGERQVHDIVIEEADFAAMYWLLKWMYSNSVMFRDEDDPRDAVASIGGGWSANWLKLSDMRNEWEATTLLPNSPTADMMGEGSDISTESPLVHLPLERLQKVNNARADHRDDY